MDWTQDLSVIDSTLYADDRWLGDFSSHRAAKTAIWMMRHPGNQVDECLDLLTDGDLDLVEAIDADER